MKKQELFGIGTRVVITRTGEIGVITEKLGDDLVSVRLSDGEEIPVFEEFLTRYSEEAAKNALSLKKNNEPAVVVNKPRDYTVSKINNTGAYLIFEPIENADGTHAFNVFFYNDTSTFLIASPLLWRKDILIEDEISAVSVKSGSIDFLTKIALNTINDSPELEIEIQKLATDGNSDTFHALVKLKTKMFIKTNAHHPVTNAGVMMLAVSTEHPKSLPSDLKKYTQQIVKQHKDEKRRNASNSQLVDWRNNLNAYAHFKNELDLHISALHSDSKTLSPAEILQIQLQVFEEYLQQSIQIGIPSIFIIHGLGTGRLRDRIAARLRRSHHVLHFKNEFHEKYGFGATEVVFKV